MESQLVAERGGTVVFSHACLKDGPSFSQAVSWGAGYPVPLDLSAIPFTESCPACGEPVTVTGDLPQGVSPREPERQPNA